MVFCLAFAAHASFPCCGSWRNHGGLPYCSRGDDLVPIHSSHFMELNVHSTLDLRRSQTPETKPWNYVRQTSILSPDQSPRPPEIRVCERLGLQLARMAAWRHAPVFRSRFSFLACHLFRGLGPIIHKSGVPSGGGPFKGNSTNNLSTPHPAQGEENRSLGDPNLEQAPKRAWIKVCSY